jgi:hypothetical protein
MNEDLKFSFTNVNDWLKFAEAKNAGLLALNAAAIIGILQCNDALLINIPFFRGLLLIIFCLSSLICIYSVLPIVNKHFKAYKKLDANTYGSKKATLNYLFFGDVAQLTDLQLIDLYQSKVGSNITLTAADQDLAGQIVNNAELSLQKFKVFNFAGWITVTGTILSIILITIGYIKL